jgi:hypothetical protein
MAIIDELNENDSQSQEEFSNITETDKAQQVEAVAPEEVKDEVPEKYKGKSVAEIAKMHEEAEKLIGRQANEVGELRKLTDEILKQQLANSKPKQEEQAPEVDFWSDPDTYLNKKLETHPDILAAKEAQRQMERQKASEILNKKHPDVLEVVKSQDFQDWVSASKVRTQLYVAADTQYDYEAADELLTTFKALNGKKAEEGQQQAKELTASRNKQLKAATVDAGGGNEVSRKVYRRADLIRLRMQDPARYEALADEIMLAYQEGRVK